MLQPGLLDGDAEGHATAAGDAMFELEPHRFELHLRADREVHATLHDRLTIHEGHLASVVRGDNEATAVVAHYTPQDSGGHDGTWRRQHTGEATARL